MKPTDRIARRYKEAFKERFNVVSMATAAAMSAATLNPLPLLAGLVAEAAYLLFVPDSQWYERRLARRYDEEVRRRREQLRRQVLPQLEPEMQDRFLRLEEMRHHIGVQATEDEPWVREVLRKLDYLLEKFLMFASKDAQFSTYLEETVDEVRSKSREAADEFLVRDRRRVRPARPPERVPPDPSGPEPADPTDRWVSKTVARIQTYYDGEIGRVTQTREQEQDLNTQAVLDRRLDVLQRRKEFFGKLGKILINLNHQLRLLEETVGLIHDELRARSPDQVLADIDDVIGQTDVMTQVLEEVAPLEQLAARMSMEG